MNSPIESDYEFRVSTSDLSDMVGKTHFTTELMLMRCSSGSAVIAMDSRKHILAANHSFLMLESVVFQVLETTSDFSVTYCSVSLPFFYELSAGLSGNIFSVLEYSAPDLYGEEKLKSADLLFENICLIYANRNHNKRRIMTQNIILSYIYEMYDLTLPFSETHTDIENNFYDHTVYSFYGLAANHSKKHRNIEFYAQKLNMSSRYLYKIVQSSIHITPKQLIDGFVISSIKQLLLTTILNNQQIADMFNFPDQSSFGQYFKRCEGMSPSAFRNRHR